MKIYINREKLDSIDLSHLNSFVDFHEDTYKFFSYDYGREHYKLLALIASQLKDVPYVVDLGTSTGASALALHYNKDLEVKTYDLVDLVPPKHFFTINNIKNITRIFKNALDDVENFVGSPVIVLDIDPHDGVQEKELIRRLEELNYKGIVVCDDIHLNPPMNQFWDSVKQKKIDITEFGHWSGTGIIIFDETNIDVTVD